MLTRPHARRPESPYDSEALWLHLKRVLITVAVIVAALLVWRIADILLLLFAAILLATLLSGFAEWISRLTSLPRRWAVTIAVGSVAVLIGGLGFFFGSQMAGEIDAVFTQVPKALNMVGDEFGIANTTERLRRAVATSDGSALFTNLATVGVTIFGVLINTVIVLVAAVFLAAEPGVHRRSIAKMFPPTYHKQVLRVLNMSGSALRLWFVAQLVSMMFVTVASAIAYWAIGLPSPVGLGIIAGATNFIPFLGPLVGAIPALLFAFAMDTNAVLWSVVAIIAIQQIDGNLVMPLVQRRTLLMPPAIVLFGILALGALFGWLGIVLGAPLAVVIVVMIEKLWMRDTLGEQVIMPGETPVVSAEQDRDG